MRRGLELALFPALVGCGLAESRFVEQFVEAQCDQAAICDESAFETTWASTGHCTNELNAAWDEVLAGYHLSECVYDSDSAKDCLDAAQAATCEDWESWAWYDAECFRVWTCPTDFQDTGVED